MMSPTPQETLHEEVPKMAGRASGDEVVISGMSGIFPKSDSIEKFMKNLYDKVDMVSSENPRWVFNHPEVPKHLGMVDGMGKFDAQFFRVHYKQAWTMEPMSRKLLEHAYSAIYDSGINPLQLRGKKVGVFIGSTFSESEKIVIYENVQRNGFGITGCNKAMYANRISYWIDGKGPSYSLDLACSSSMACIEHAYRSISSGQCDAAIVGGCNLCMHPNVSLHCRRAGFLCLDGKTKCFDKNGDGHVRSDAISVMFLQKAKDAKRIYSEVYHAKMSFSPTTERLLPVREPKELEQFLEAFYSDIGISPTDVEYIEANGAAFVEADSNELQAIGRVFGKETPIKIGCVKSNMGSSEPASGICALTKVCLAYHNGKIPGNINYNEPLDIPEVKDNKIQVLTDTADFKRGFAALNSFSYGGANVHVLLKGHYKKKDTAKYASSIPHLVLLSGRKDTCVKPVMDALKNKPIDPEEIGLLHNIHQYDIPGHMSRGYTILDTSADNKTKCLANNIQYNSGTIRPLWFVYSGMGSQWATMGAELMRIPIFAAAIQKCHNVLEPKGIDIVRILCEPDNTIYDNILNSFVGIAAVQIGLTDILTELGIVPDNIIGHSVGELGCAYADGCFTAEEMILSAYSRGLVSVQTPFIRGSMAAVGLGYKAVLPLCPPEIEVACHNSSDSATISGPAGIMKKFVSELVNQGIFAKEVPCSNIAYHSRYIAGAGPNLLKYLSEVIKTPKLRSKKWVSTSVPEDKWNEPIAKYSSAEYHTNNLLNSVLFEETSKLIPSDALVIEIAPHGLLQAILKRSLVECMHVPLTRRGAPDPVKFLLEAVGKLYQAGINPKVDVLYPKIEYPVSTGTPFLSQYVKWEHSEDWSQAKYKDKGRKMATIREFVMSIHDDDFSYLRGHVIEGKYVFPEAAILQLTWETLAMFKGVSYKDMSVMFGDVIFHKEAIIKEEFPLRLQIMIHKGNNKFEVTHEDSTIVSGFISSINADDLTPRKIEEDPDTDTITLTAEDVYTIMRLRGYYYKDDFQSIYSTNSNRTKASIKWTDKWIPFLDSVFQFNAFARNHDGVSTPSLIKKLTIDVQKHDASKRVISDDLTCVTANIFSIYECFRCGGVEVDGLVFNDSPVLEQKYDVLLNQEFVPHLLTGKIELPTALHINLQLVAENVSDSNVKIIVSLSNELSTITELLKDSVLMIPSADFIFKEMDIFSKKLFGLSNLLVIEELLGCEEKIKQVYEAISKDTFVLTFESDTTNIQLKYPLFNVVTAMSVGKHTLILLRKVNNSDINVIYLPITQDRNFSWIPRLQSELKKTRKIFLVSERQPYCGLLGMVKKLRQEFGNKIGLIVIDDYNVPAFNANNRMCSEQLEKNLAINIFKKGQWGGYYYITGDNITNNEGAMQLIATTPGEIESLTWIENPIKSTSKLQVQVCYAGPSFRDAQNATSKTRRENQSFGMDFSGITKSGEKVMGLVSGGAIASTVQADPDLLWPVPDHWTLEDAATVPLAYTLAYYCLAVNRGAFSNENIFIAGGCSAIGQACISICQSLNCTVFTSVSCLKKKEFLMKIFPNLDEKNIAVSTSGLLFKDMVRLNTEGKNCFIVINCLSGESRKAAMSCTSSLGDFFDLSDCDMKNNGDFGMSFLRDDKSYISVNINTIFRPEYAAYKKCLQILISDGIANGVVRPIARMVFSPANVTRAFRLLSSRKRAGKILIRMNNPQSSNYALNITSKMDYSSKGTYVVVCDDNILGMELAERLVKQGARKLMIHMNQNSLAGYCYSKFLYWSKNNVTVEISSENLQTQNGCIKFLKDAIKLGPILGIFIVQNLSATESLASEDVAAKFNNSALVVANLDLMSRNVCNELENFVVICHSNKNITDEYIATATDRICNARKEINLPSLFIRVDLLKEFEDDPERSRSSLSAIFNAVETSLKRKYSSVISFNTKNNAASDFMQRISKILDVKNINAIDENISLKNLLVHDIVIEEINTVIKETYQISNTVEKTREMTISDLKNLGNINNTRRCKASSGLGVFFTYIEKDECMAAEPVLTMATAFSNVQEEDELDPKATYLMLLPGFESHYEIFTDVSERLKVQAVALQYEPELANANIPEIAASIMKLMKKRFEMKSKFYLLGYSFGVNVALELAALFEKEGHVGVVYCLDSSPDALRAQLEAYLGHLPEAQLQNNLVEHMYRLMNGQNSQELVEKLEKIDIWEEKVELCVKMTRGIVNFSHQYKRSILQGAYRRIMLARDYEPNFKLQSELVLMKAIPHPDVKHLTEDYGLSKYTRKQVQFFNIEADHSSAPSDCRVANIVNRLLEPKLLEAFKNKNLCWSYIADPIKSW